MLRFIAIATAALEVGFFAAPPASAQTMACSNNAAYGYIGQKWTAFNGPSSSLGCPLAPEQDYSPVGLDAAKPAGARQQQFQHGTIVYYPSLGPKMTFSAWWNTPAKIHVEFTDLATRLASFRIGLSAGGTTRYVDLPGGTGHNTDIAVSFPQGVSVSLQPCADVSNVGHKIVCPANINQVPVIYLQASQATNSYADNGRHVLQTTYGYYLKEAIWPNRNINVCWNMSDDVFAQTQVERDRIRSAIASTWEANAPVKFLGWAKCGGIILNGFGIDTIDENPKTEALGVGLNGNLSGMTLNFAYKTWPCGYTVDQCDTWIAEHEFGHALGLAHENNRPGSKQFCPIDPQGQDGDVTVGAWDRSSIMNYCNPNWNGYGKLSPTDIKTIQDMYGKPTVAPQTKTLNFPHSSAGDCEMDGATLTLNSNGVATWHANVKTNHTHTGDVYHTTISLSDPVQNTVQQFKDDSMTMSDDHGYYSWDKVYAFPASLFPEIVGGHLDTSC